LYYKGQAVKQSYKMAKKYYDQACCNKELYVSYCFGVGEACNNKAILYRYGKGVKKNIKLASKYYWEACSKGYKKACKDFESLKKKLR
jgi:TPR repeat protein